MGLFLSRKGQVRINSALRREARSILTVTSHSAYRGSRTNVRGVLRFQRDLQNILALLSPDGRSVATLKP